MDKNILSIYVDSTDPSRFVVYHSHDPGVGPEKSVNLIAEWSLNGEEPNAARQMVLSLLESHQAAMYVADISGSDRRETEDHPGYHVLQLIINAFFLGASWGQANTQDQMPSKDYDGVNYKVDF